MHKVIDIAFIQEFTSGTMVVCHFLITFSFSAMRKFNEFDLIAEFNFKACLV
jgi:hypothetical protein